MGVGSADEVGKQCITRVNLTRYIHRLNLRPVQMRSCTFTACGQMAPKEVDVEMRFQIVVG